MSRTLVALAFLSVTATAAPVPKSVKVGDYFPLQLGNTWVYDDGETREVTAWDARDGRANVTHRHADSGLTYEKTYLVLNNKVLQIRDGPREYGPSTRVSPLPLRPGATWSYLGTRRDGTTLPDDHKAGEPEEVTVPAGTFVALPVTFTRSGLNGEMRVDTSWYAKGIGLVKFESIYGVKQLKSFTPGTGAEK